MVCRESGLALLVLACTGLLAECRHEDMLQSIAALIQGHRLQSGLERMPPTCAVRGIALLVVICSGLMEVYCVAGNIVVVSTVLLAVWG